MVLFRKPEDETSLLLYDLPRLLVVAAVCVSADAPSFSPMISGRILCPCITLGPGTSRKIEDRWHDAACLDECLDAFTLPQPIRMPNNKVDIYKLIVWQRLSFTHDSIPPDTSSKRKRLKVASGRKH